MRELCTDTAGTAMSEGLIVAGFFVFLLACVVHMHRMYDSKLAVHTATQDCAWSYVSGGCQALPERCRGATVESGAQPVGLEEFVQENAGGLAGRLNEASGFAHRMLDELGAVGHSATVELHSDAVDRPLLLGGGNGTTRTRYSLLCNERTRTPGELMKDAFCRVVQTSLLGC